MKNVAIEEILANDRFVRGLAKSLVHGSVAADDVAQETYLRAMKSGPREGGSVRGWLATVIRNIAANLGRGGRHRTERERAASVAEASDPASLIVEREELRRRLLGAILQLGAPRSTIVLMRYFEGLAPRAIAKRLGMPVETVRTHLKRSLALLRARLGSETQSDGRSLLMALPMLAAGSRDLGASIGMVLMSLKAKIALASACVLVAVSVWVATKIDWNSDSVHRPTPAPASIDREASAAQPSKAPGPIVGAPFREDAPAESLPHDAVAGIVVDEAGAPISGARVFVCDAGAKTPIPIGAIEPNDGIPSATTDPSGRFSVSLKPPDRVLALCACASGFSPAVLAPVAMGSRQTLALARAVRIKGRTLDTAGNAVKNARIRWSAEGRGVSLVRETTSGDSGEFEIGDLPSGALARELWQSYLGAEAAGFAPLAIHLRESGRDFTAPASVVEQDLVLARGVRLQGRVYDAETNAPITDVALGFHSWVSAEGMKAWGSRSKPDRQATTDERGKYAFDTIPSLGFHPLGGRVAGNPVGFVRVRPLGFAVGTVDIPSSPEGATLDIDIPCWHTAKVRGRVVDAEGKPVPGTTIWAYVRSLGNVQAQSVSAGPDGRFVLDGIAAKTSGSTPVEVFANPEDASSLTPGAGEFAKHELDLRAGEDVQIPDLVLNPLLSARLRVLDENGLPVRQARARSGIRGMGAETNAAGRCRLVFESHSEGQTCNVRIWAAGFASASVALAPSRKPEETTIVLKPGRSLRGRVLWSDRSPARDVGLTLAQGPGASAVLTKGPEIGVWGDDYYKTFFISTQSDPEGRFEFLDLPEGPYEIAAAVSPEGQSTDRVETVQATASNVREDGLEIILPSDGAALRDGVPLEGTVTLAGGRPVVSFTAALSNKTMTRYGILPSVGRFRFERVPAGKWSLRIEGSGFVKVDREVVVDPSGPPPRIDVVVDEGLSIIGTVRVPPGERLADVMVFFRRGEDDVGTQAIIAADGSYRASGLVAGRHTLFVTYPNAGHWGRALTATGALAVEVKAGKAPTRRDIEVVRGGWVNVGIAGALLKGRGKTQLLILDASGTIISEWGITPLEEDVGGYGNQMALPEGTYTVRLEDGGKVIASAAATASAAAAVTVQLE